MDEVISVWCEGKGRGSEALANLAGIFREVAQAVELMRPSTVLRAGPLERQFLAPDAQVQLTISGILGEGQEGSEAPTDGRILAEVLAERRRQQDKWGSQYHWPQRWLCILLEEAGEAAKAMLWQDGQGYRIEMLQVAAVAVAAIWAFDQGGALQPPGALPPVFSICGRCRGVVPSEDAETCWYCTMALCAECWDRYGHCGHPEADAQNERMRAWIAGKGRESKLGHE